MPLEMAKPNIINLLSLLHKRCLKTTAAAALPKPTKDSTFTLQFLVNSCGFPVESALSASKKLQLDEKSEKQHQSVIDLFKSHGFNESQIAKLIEKRPRILHSIVGNNLKPKFEYLIENGFVGQLLPELILKNPRILGTSLNSRIKPSFEILRSFVHSNVKIAIAIKRCTWLLTSDLEGITLPSIDILMKEGVPITGIGKLFVWHPRVLMQNHDRMVYAVNAAKNLGFEPSHANFVHAIRVFLSMSESTWKKKMEVMQSFGWSQEQILLAFRKQPFSLMCSEEKLRRIMNFYVNTMKLEPEAVISCPLFLMYGIETRLLPRYNVFKILDSKQLIGKNVKLEQLLKLTVKTFVNNYVIKYLDEVPGLLEIYNGTHKAA